MKVFLSWFKPRSEEAAKLIGAWMNEMVQSLECWLSSDLDRGGKWLAEIEQALDEHDFGVLFVTPENVTSPWLNYEAGALSRHLEDGRVIPYLLEFKSMNDLPPPLGQYNGCLADEKGTWRLIQTLNKFAEFSRTEATLRKFFDQQWPDLKTNLERIISTQVPKPDSRGDEDKMEELLTTVRGLAQIITKLDDPRQINPGDTVVTTGYALQPIPFDPTARESRNVEIDAVRAIIRETLGSQMAELTLIHWSGGKLVIRSRTGFSPADRDRLNEAFVTSGREPSQMTLA